MPLVTFDHPGAPLDVHAPEACRLLDVCDEHSARVPFSCRSASCGTCRIEVLEGAECLEPPAQDELDLLAIFGDDPARHRLACQVRLRPGASRLRIRPVE